MGTVRTFSKHAQKRLHSVANSGGYGQGTGRGESYSCIVQNLTIAGIWSKPVEAFLKMAPRNFNNLEENSMSHIHLTKEDMMGSQLWRV